jgi:hypothetical protein
MDVTRSIRYEGDSAQLARLVQILQSKRVLVQETPTPGRPGGPAPGLIEWSTDIQQVVITLVAAGSLTSINKAVAKFRKKFPRANVVVGVAADQGKLDGEQAQSTQG